MDKTKFTILIAPVLFFLGLVSHASAATEFISTIQQSGGDYSTLASWEDAIECDLTASTTAVYSGTGTGKLVQGYIVELYRGGVYQSVTSTVVATTSSQILVQNVSSTSTIVFQNNDQWRYGGSTSTMWTISGTGAQLGDTPIAIAKIDGAWTAADPDAVTIDGWTTSATHYIKIYTTPAARHNGKWNTGRYRLSYTAVEYSAALTIVEEYVRVEGLQVERFGSTSANGNMYGILINTTSVTADVHISHNIIRSTLTGSLGTRYVGIYCLTGTGKVWNNISYDWYLPAVSDGMGIAVYNTYNGSVYYIYNNTSYGNYYGSIKYNTNATIVLKNNISYNNTDNYYGTFSASSTNNLSGPTQTDAPGSNPRNGVTVTFVDEAGDNFHLRLGDSAARNNGANLGQDANLAFSDDIDSQSRPETGAWDIGADEVARTTQINTPLKGRGPTGGLVGYWSFDGQDMNGNTVYDRSPSGGVEVTLDAVGPGSSGAGGANPSSPLEWSHTCSGDNRVLFVGIAVGDRLGSNQFTVTGVTYNGVALTEITHRHSNDDTYGYATLWYLTAPDTGTHTVSVTFTRTNPDVLDAIEAGSISFNGVDQATPYQNTASAVGYSTNPSVDVTSSLGNMVLDVVANGSTISSSGQTNRWLRNVNDNSAGGNGAQSTAAGAASVTMSYTVTSDWWAIIGVDVKAAAFQGANDGTNYGAKPVPGISGQALSFDGVDDYVDMGPTPSVLNITGNLTISAWIKPWTEGEAGAGRIVDNMGLVGEDGYIFFITPDISNGLKFWTYGGAVSSDADVITMGQWQHVVVKLSGTTATFYVNGVDAGGGTVNVPTASSLHFLIGNEPDAPNRTFDGLIDEVRVYNRALSPSEITDLYRAGASRLKIVQYPGQHSQISEETWTGNKFISVIKQSGGDYNSLNAWESAINCDLTTSTTYTGEWDNQVGSDIADGTTVTWDSGTKSGTLRHMTTVAKSGKNAFLISGATGLLEDNDTVVSGANSFDVYGTPSTGAIAIAKIDGAWTSADTTAVAIDGWTTNATHYIKIYTTAAARHDGKWNTGKYRLETTGYNTITIKEQYVRLDGLQVYCNNNYTASGNYGVIEIWLTGDANSDVRVSNSIIKALKSSVADTMGIGIWDFNAKIYNNIIYDMSSVGLKNINTTQVTYAYNNTIINSYRGFYCASGYLRIKNNLAKGNTAGDFVKAGGGSYIDVSDYNASSDATADDFGGTGNRINQTFTFVDATNKDFHLRVGDSAAKNNGANLSNDANLSFSDDIDSQRRTGAWDIGADEVAGTMRIGN